MHTFFNSLYVCTPGSISKRVGVVHPKPASRSKYEMRLCIYKRLHFYNHSALSDSRVAKLTTLEL